MTLTAAQRSEGGLLSWHGLTEEERAERIAQLHTPPARAKKGASLRRYWESMSKDERRAANEPNLEAARAVRFKCDECGLKLPAGPLAMHQKGSGHTGRTRAEV